MLMPCTLLSVCDIRSTFPYDIHRERETLPKTEHALSVQKMGCFLVKSY